MGHRWNSWDTDTSQFLILKSGLLWNPLGSLLKNDAFVQ